MRGRWGAILRYLASAAAASLFGAGAALLLLLLLPEPVLDWLWIPPANSHELVQHLHHSPSAGLFWLLGRYLLASAEVFVVFAGLFAPVHWVLLKARLSGLGTYMAAGAGVMFIASGLTSSGWAFEIHFADLVAALGAGMGAVFRLILGGPQRGRGQGLGVAV